MEPNQRRIFLTSTPVKDSPYKSVLIYSPTMLVPCSFAPLHVSCPGRLGIAYPNVPIRYTIYDTTPIAGHLLGSNLSTPKRSRKSTIPISLRQLNTTSYDFDSSLPSPFISTLNPDCEPFFPDFKFREPTPFPDFKFRKASSTPELNPDDSISRQPTPQPSTCPICRGEPNKAFKDGSDSGVHSEPPVCPCCQQACDPQNNSSSSLSDLESYLNKSDGKNEDATQESCTLKENNGTNNDRDDEDDDESSDVDDESEEQRDDETYNVIEQQYSGDGNDLKDTSKDSTEFSTSWPVCAEISTFSDELLSLCKFLSKTLTVPEYLWLMREAGAHDPIIMAIRIIVEDELEQMQCIFAHWLNLQKDLNFNEIRSSIVTALQALDKADLITYLLNEELLNSSFYKL